MRGMLFRPCSVTSVTEACIADGCTLDSDLSKKREEDTLVDVLGDSPVSFNKLKCEQQQQIAGLVSIVGTTDHGAAVATRRPSNGHKRGKGALSFLLAFGFSKF